MMATLVRYLAKSSLKLFNQYTLILRSFIKWRSLPELTAFKVRQISTDSNNEGRCLCSHHGQNRYYTDLEERIRSITELSTDHLTPEIRLHLITERCDQWTAAEDEIVFPDPYWAFYWPGGQALTRYLLESVCLRDQRVLDVGSGCGASAIAAVLSQAAFVVANDIDPVALYAIALNAEQNGVNLHTTAADLIGRDLRHLDVFPTKIRITGSQENLDIGSIRLDGWHCDVVLVGDMFYDEFMTSRIMEWIAEMGPHSRVLLGEPGRPYFDRKTRDRFHQIAEYELPLSARRQNHGLTSAGVYEYRPL